MCKGSKWFSLLLSLLLLLLLPLATVYIYTFFCFSRLLFHFLLCFIVFDSSLAFPVYFVWCDFPALNLKFINRWYLHFFFFFLFKWNYHFVCDVASSSSCFFLIFFWLHTEYSKFHKFYWTANSFAFLYYYYYYVLLLFSGCNE